MREERNKGMIIGWIQITDDKRRILCPECGPDDVPNYGPLIREAVGCYEAQCALCKSIYRGTRWMKEQLLLPSRAVTLEVMKAVHDFAYDRNSRIPRSVIIDQWGLSDEEYDQCKFDGRGYLVIGIHDVQIVEMEFEYGIQTWTVECCVDLGYDFSDTDGYSAYKDDKGEWYIEWEYS